MALSKGDVEALESARRQAMLTADVTTLGELLADEMSWVHASSRRDTRDTFIRGIGDKSLQPFRLDHSEVEIKIYDAVAVVTGLVAMEVAINGERATRDNRFTAIWVGDAGKARLVLWQSTSLPPTAAAPDPRRSPPG